MAQLVAQTNFPETLHLAVGKLAQLLAQAEFKRLREGLPGTNESALGCWAQTHQLGLVVSLAQSYWEGCGMAIGSGGGKTLYALRC